MYIAHIATECTPLAKAGGLGDVVSGLAEAFARKGDHVDVILPKYDFIDSSFLEGSAIAMRDLWVSEKGRMYNTTIWKGTYAGLNIFLIEPHHPSYYFNRPEIYGYDIDNDRFLFFCKAALEFLVKSGRHPDILHLHDWPTAAVAPLYHEHYQTSLDAGCVVMNIHNMEHQGKCAPFNIENIGLDPALYHTPSMMSDPTDPSLVNLLKGGIQFSDKVITVSKKYAEEIQTPTYAYGLEETIRLNKQKLQGILNGIDYYHWDPRTDPFLHMSYHPEKKGSVIHKKKRINQAHLYSSLGMTPQRGPLLIAVSRLVTQKSPELIFHAIEKTLALGSNFILLGSVSEPRWAKALEEVKERYKDHPHVRLFLEFNPELAHILFAAADAIVVPSLFEPCGLTQMIAMRYGTIPLVRATGGLADTVIDIDDTKQTLKEKTGFVFDAPTTEALDLCLTRLLNTFQQKKKWMQLIENGARQDFSWDRIADNYRSVYHDTLSAKGFYHIF